MLIFNRHLRAYGLSLCRHATLLPLEGILKQLKAPVRQLMDELEKCRKDSSVVNKTTKMGEH